MELNNKIIRIPAGNPELLKRIIYQFNEDYGTDFSVFSVEDLDGVTFVYIKFDLTTIDDIYLLGFYHGMEIQELRQKGEIDW